MIARSMHALLVSHLTFLFVFENTLLLTLTGKPKLIHIRDIAYFGVYQI